MTEAIPIFRILGPLEVERAGATVPMGGPRVSAILGVLVLAEGAELHADTITDQVWGEDPPPSVRASLQMHISKIRKTLSGLDIGARLVTHGSSYALRIDKGYTDLGIFRSLIAEGEVKAGEGDHATALDRWTRALALWRGEPLADLDLANPDQSAISALLELRGHAARSRIAALLALGRYDDAAIRALEERTAHPLDEHLAALTATALVGAGRSGDALGQLEALRHALSEQLGMEPGPAVKELERRILAGDETIAPARGGAESRREVRKTVTVVALRLPPGDPEQVHAATRAVSDLLEGAVSNLGGWCPPARSGRLLGVFGIPEVHEDDAERAVRTADALARAARAMGMHARIGVSTGEVLVETDGRTDELLTHEPVESADQLARKAKAGEVLIGLGTFRLVKAVATVDDTPVLLVDEGEQPLVAHRLIDVSQTAVARRLSSTMVGREQEIEGLRVVAVDAIDTRHTKLVTILGPAGVGKSRLVSEFSASLGDRVEVASTKCLPFERDVGVGPILPVLRAVAAVPADAAPQAIERRLEEFIGPTKDADHLVAQLSSLLGSGASGPAPDELHWAIKRCLETAALRHPLMVVVEDLQWADDSLIELIGYLATSIVGVPVLLVCSARPDFRERRTGWPSSVETIHLEPLDAPEADRLLSQLLGAHALGAEALGRIAAIAEGNPLFIEETLSMLIDEGHLTQQDGRWAAAADLATVALPPTVRALLEARLDRLSVPERSVIEMVAVIGREFTDEDIEALRPEMDATSLGTSLDSLCRRDFLELSRFSRPGAREYSFRHSTVREVVYRATSREARAADHEAFGRSLFARYPDRLTEIEEIAAFHLESAYDLRAGLPGSPTDLANLGKEAARHLASAGKRAFGRDDVAAAANLFARAIGCLGSDDAEIGELSRLRGAALFDLGRFDEAEAALQRGLEIAEQIDDAALRWRLEVEIVHAVTYLRPGDRSASEVLAFAEGATDALTRLGDTAGVARAERLRGEALSLLGRQEEALDAYVRGWQLARDAGDEREVALRPQPTGVHGPTPLDVVIGQCDRLVAETGRPRPETLMRLALALALRGEEERSRESIETGLSIAHEVGGAFRVADAEVHAGACYLYMGDAESAVEHLTMAVGELRRIGESSVRSTAVALLGEALVRTGELRDAADAAAESRALAAEDDQATQMAWRQVAAKIAAAKGDLVLASSLVEEAREVAEATDFLVMGALVHVDAAAIATTRGNLAEARGDLTAAASRLDRKGARGDLPAVWLRDVPLLDEALTGIGPS